jgi:acyl carrier protein
MEKEVKDRIRETFSRFITDEGELDAVFSGERILTAVSIDSLTMLNLVTELERDFSIRFDYETIEMAFEDIHALSAFLGGESGKKEG